MTSRAPPQDCYPCYPYPSNSGPEGTAAHPGLFDDPSEPGAVRVVGTVHNILALDDGSALFDVYVQAGPEYLTFRSSDLPGRPPVLRDSIEATVRGLCVYPSWV